MATGTAGNVEERAALIGEHADAVLDARALSEIRERVRELRAEARAATEASQLARAAAAQSEIEAIQEHLSPQLRPGGARKFAGVTERARSSVTKAVRGAIRNITAADPNLGGYLQQVVATGTECCYRPIFGGPEITIRRR